MATMHECNILAKDFLLRIQGLITPKEYQFTLDQLRRNAEIWLDWRQSPGIYCFLQNEAVLYVGRATFSVGLGRRVNNQINAFGDSKWDTVINDGKTICKLFVFTKEDWHWVAALELYLIENLGKPVFNKRRG